MKSPLILVFASRNEDLTFCSIRYTDALMSFGGIPLIVPMKTDKKYLKQLCETADGFLFAGGVDLDPALYGEDKYNDTVEIDAVRDELELTAMEYVFKTDKPVLGICRGIQSVNVGLGGTLWQDIPAQIGDAVCHKQTNPGTEPTHRVTIKPKTKLHGITGADTVWTNSFHHQAVKKPGRDLIISAVSDDGIIEALEGKGNRFLMLVQWHPEFTATTDKTSEAIFRAFVEEAKSNSK